MNGLYFFKVNSMEFEQIVNIFEGIDTEAHEAILRHEAQATKKHIMGELSMEFEEIEELKQVVSKADKDFMIEWTGQAVNKIESSLKPKANNSDQAKVSNEIKLDIKNKLGDFVGNWNKIKNSPSANSNEFILKWINDLLNKIKELTK